MQNFIETILSAFKLWTKKEIKASTADWNENDTNAASYIKNRTHWENKEGKIKTLIPKTTITIEEDGGYVELNISFDTLEVGKTYIVTLNNVEYKCVAKKYNTNVFIGNSTIYGDGLDNTGEPFSCNSQQDGTFYLNVATAGEYTFKLSTFTSTIKQLDEKFIPSTIARKQNVTKEIDKATEETIDIFNQSLNTVNERILKLEEIHKFDRILLTDTVNNANYYVYMRNGNLVSSCKIASIAVESMPEKTEYIDGDYLDPTGLVIKAICEDGSEIEITDFVCGYADIDSSSATITCMSFGETHITSVPVSVKPFDPSLLLIDFTYNTYTNDEDSKPFYVINGWKQTLNGEPSTELVVPDNVYVKI